MLLTVTLSLLEGLGTTMELFALTLLLALPLGLVIALGAMSRLRPSAVAGQHGGVGGARHPPDDPDPDHLLRPGPAVRPAPAAPVRGGAAELLSSTTPAIFPRSTGAASSPSPGASTRRARCWA